MGFIKYYVFKLAKPTGVIFTCLLLALSACSKGGGKGNGGDIDTLTGKTILSLEVVPPAAVLSVSDDMQFRALAHYNDGTMADVTSQVEWVTDHTTIAQTQTISGVKGWSKAIGTGVTLMKARFGSVMASTDITVTAATLVSVEISPAAASFPAGVVQQFHATGLYSDGTTQDLTSTAVWSSSNAALLTVSDAAGTKGQVTLRALGNATVSVTVGGITGTTSVSVSPATLVSLQVQPSTLDLPNGLSSQLTLTGIYSDSSTADLTLAANWASSSANVVVDNTSQKGKITGLVVGNSSVTATFGALSVSSAVRVVSASLVSLKLDPENITVANGVASSFTVSALFSDGSSMDVTDWASWSSSDATIAFVSNSAGTKGHTNTLTVGSAILKATYQGINAQTTLTVSSAVLTGISVTPATLSLANGVAAQYNATGTYSDGSTSDITSSVTWASSNAGVATVTNAGATKGLTTARGIGSAQVQITSGAFSAHADLTVTSATLVSVQLNPASLSLSKGLTQNMSATGVYSDGSTVDLTAMMTWSSSDPAILSVSNAAASKGLLQSNAVGNATVTASYGGVQGTVSVTATNAVVSSMSASVTSSTMAKGTTSQAHVIGNYSDGTSVDITESVSWSSADSSLVSVSSAAGTKGLITAAGVGNANITATLGSVTSTFNVTVTSATIVSVEISPTTLSLSAGHSQSITATALYSDGSSADVTSLVNWTSSNSSVASVSNAGGSKGLVSVLSSGSAVVTASIGGQSTQINITGSSATLSSLNVTPSVTTIPNGNTLAYTATGTFSDGSTMDMTSSVAWSSSDTSVITVNNSSGSKGNARALSQGTATITATSGAVTGSTGVTVSSAVLSSIAVTPANQTLPKGVHQAFTASGLYSDNSVVDITASVTWSSSDSSALSVSNSAGNHGLGSALAVGSSTVTASLGGVNASTSVTVTSASLVSLQVTPSVQSVANGQNQQFQATGTYSDGNVMDITANVTWTSSSASVAAISNAVGTKGYASSASAGITTITATLSGVNNTAVLTVTAATLVRIEFNPSTLSMPKGLGQAITATGIYSDSTTADLSSSVTWSSSNNAVVTVSNAAGSKGLVTGVGVGTATVTGTLGAVSASFSVTISSATLVSINVTAAQSSFAKGNTSQLTATGTYTDGTSTDITSSVSWSTADATLLTVSNAGGSKGLSTGVNPGTVVATATLGAVSGNISIIVTAAALNGISVSPTSASIAKGLTQALVATGSYTDGSTANITNAVAWSSADATIAAVSSANGSKGLVSGLAQGNATITASLSGLSGQSTISVTAATLSTIAVTHSGTDLAKGLYRQLTATGTYSDGSTADLTTSVVWSSSFTSFVTVNNAAGSKGKVFSVAPGDSTITATLGGVSGTSNVHTVAAVLLSVSVTPNDVFVIVLASKQLTAIATYTDGTVDVTNAATWSTGNTGLIQISIGTKGFVTVIGVGTTTVTATFGGMSGVSTFHGILN